MTAPQSIRLLEAVTRVTILQHLTSSVTAFLKSGTNKNITLCANAKGLKITVFFMKLMAAVTGLEPAASGVTVRYLRVI